jgi:hypothetical protein
VLVIHALSLDDPAVGVLVERLRAALMV